MNRAAAKRPLGILIQWLRQGFCFDSHEEHLESAKIITDEEVATCRAWMMGQPHLAHLASMESQWAADGAS